MCFRKWVQLFLLASFVMALYFDPTGILGSVSRCLRAIAMAAEEAAAVGSKVVGAGANLSVNSAQVAAAAIDSTMDAAGEFWRGVDLVNIQGNRTVVRLASPSAEALHTWLAGGANSLVALSVIPRAVEMVDNMTTVFPFV